MGVNKKKVVRIRRLIIIYYVLVVIVWFVSKWFTNRSIVAPNLLSFSQLFAILALSGLSLQPLLSSRWQSLERGVGLERLVSWHKKNAKFVYVLAAIHPIYIAFYYLRHTISPLRAVLAYGWPYLVGVATLVTLTLIVFTSIYRNTIKIKYQTWQLIHKLVYVALVLAFIHALFIGSDVFIVSPLFIWLICTMLLAIVGIYLRVVLRHLRKNRHEFAVVDIKKETHNVHTITLESIDKPVCDFMPGQFAFVSFKSKRVSDEEHHFTIASAPNKQFVQFSIKESGDFTSTVKDLEIGDRALVEGPFGVFVNPNNEGPIVFTAGGIGVTPIMSMLRTMHETGLYAPTVLIYANQTRNDIVFLDELNEIAEQGWLKIVHVLSKEQVEGYYSGYVSKEIYEKEVGNVKEKKHFVVGPDAMNKAVLGVLEELEVPKENIFTERFTLV
ncbi:ferric reductase-like transmembrane domain-containing protein [candidate division WWE3 bacterium]|uniref:Ferric reductase-like transmembrane domain-containing protein n=1 Tax=candidate division WWE3 bacterium TaxID=2053526 RepID=A0A955LKS8_UNCKA|nr:ferric reductase-like transmembrane domain-containing protein [candidate division WWE3 bacterium]